MCAFWILSQDRSKQSQILRRHSEGKFGSLENVNISSIAKHGPFCLCHECVLCKHLASQSGTTLVVWSLKILCSEAIWVRILVDKIHARTILILTKSSTIPATVGFIMKVKYRFNNQNKFAWIPGGQFDLKKGVRTYSNLIQGLDGQDSQMLGSRS